MSRESISGTSEVVAMDPILKKLEPTGFTAKMSALLNSLASSPSLQSKKTCFIAIIYGEATYKCKVRNCLLFDVISRSRFYR